MSIIGLDWGRRRIGVALATSLRFGVQPLAIIQRRSRREDLARLSGLVRQWQPERIVIGLPLNPDGSEGVAAAAARRVATWLANEFKLTVELFDERLTSFEARARLAELAGDGVARRSQVDQMAAALILEGWLQAQPAGESGPARLPGGES
jgi:putative Holliday junction resolvase